MSLIKENGRLMISDDNYFNTDENAYEDGYVTRETVVLNEYEKPLGAALKELSELVDKYGDKAVLNIVAMPEPSDFEGFGGNYVPLIQIVRPSTEDEIKEFKEYMRARSSPEAAKKERIRQLEEELKRLKESDMDEDGIKEHVLTKTIQEPLPKVDIKDQPIMVLPSESIIKKEKPPTTEEKMEFSKKLSTAFDMTTVYAEQQKKLEEGRELLTNGLKKSK